jgi:hypothetical protein
MEPEMDVDIPEPRGTKRPIEEPESPPKPRKIRVNFDDTCSSKTQLI